MTCPVQAPHREQIAGFDSEFNRHYLTACCTTANLFGIHCGTFKIDYEHLILKEIGCFFFLKYNQLGSKFIIGRTLRNWRIGNPFIGTN